MYPQQALTIQQPQPLFWTQMVAITVNIMILIALGLWVFSQGKKAVRGEEVSQPVITGRLGPFRE